MRNYRLGKFLAIPTTSNTNIQVKINNRISTRLRPQEMYTQITEKLGDEYWVQRLSWDKETANLVAWDEIEIASAGLEKIKWITILKISTGHVPVGHKMKQRNQRKDDKCPCCGKKETVNHMFRCKSAIAKYNWEKLTNNIKETMVKLHTKPTIRDNITNYIDNWRNYDKGDEDNIHEKLNLRKIREHQARKTQDKIEGRQLLCGKIGKDWGKIQGEYYKIIGKKQTQRQWEVRMIKSLWKETNEFWKARCKFTHSSKSLWAPKWRKYNNEMIIEEWEKGPMNVKGEAARWWKISLQTLLNNSEEDKNLWLQSARAAKKKHKRNNKTRQQMMTKWIRKRQ